MRQITEHVIYFGSEATYQTGLNPVVRAVYKRGGTWYVAIESDAGYGYTTAYTFQVRSYTTFSSRGRFVGVLSDDEHDAPSFLYQQVMQGAT